MKLNSKSICTIAAIVIALLVPLVVKDQYLMHLLIMTCVWAVVATNWNLTLGYGGMFHIAQMTFFAVGGYFSGIFATYLGISPYIAALMGGVIAAGVAFIIGVPSLRVQGVYLILLTFACHFAIKELVDHFRAYTGGSMGMIVPAFKFAGKSLNTTQHYYLILALLLVAILVNQVIIRSNTGKALIAVRDSEVLAKSTGVNPYKFKMLTFTIAAAISGVAGAFYASYLRVIGPEIFSFSIIVNGLGMIVIGGIGTITGPIIGSFIITCFMEIFTSLDDFRVILIGLVMILALLFAPHGIVTEITKGVNFIKKRMANKKKGDGDHA